MRDKNFFIFIFYFVLILGGSWYFGNYSKRELTPAESHGIFKETIKQAQAGMNPKQCEEYNKFAGVITDKDFGN